MRRSLLSSPSGIVELRRGERAVIASGWCVASIPNPGPGRSRDAKTSSCSHDRRRVSADDGSATSPARPGVEGVEERARADDGGNRIVQIEQVVVAGDEQVGVADAGE
jgi:hypothetical protein